MAATQTIIIRLLARNEQLLKEMDRTKAAIERTQQVALGASTAIAVGLAALGAAAGVAGGAAIRLAAQWEQTEIAFGTLLGSGEKARDFLADLDRFAARTPFELPGLIDASRRLLAFGFTAQQVIPMMTSVGDAVAAIGGGEFEIQRVVRALGQMSAKGRVTSQEMSLQLAELGIPAWRYLAEAIGTDIPTAMDMVERRMVPAAVGIQAILGGMTRDFGGSMQVQARTMVGLWSTAKDELRTVARGIGAYLVEAFDIKATVSALGAAVGGLANQIRAAERPAEAIRQLLARAFAPEYRLVIISLAGAIVGALTPAFLALAGAIKTATLALLPLMLKGAAVALTIWTVYRAISALRGGAAATAGASGTAAAAAGAMADQQQRVTTAATGAAAAQAALGEETQEAAKAASRNLMAFDQVHQIQEQTAKSAAAITMPAVQPAMALPELALPTVEEIAGPITAMAKAWDGATAAVRRFEPAIQVVAGLVAAYTLITLPLVISKKLALGKTALATAGKVVIAWGIKTAAAVVGGAQMIIVAGMVIGKWVAMGINAMAAAGASVVAWGIKKAAALAAVPSIVGAALTVVGKWVLMAATATAKAVAMAAAWFVALGPVGWVIATVALVALAVIRNWEAVKAATTRIWTAVGTWLTARWEGIRDSVSAAVTALRTRLAAAWEGMVATVQSAVARITAPIDAIIDAVRRALDWLARLTGAGAPRVGGGRVSPPVIGPDVGGIPAFQRGGVVLGTKPTLALLHPPEAVIPLGRGSPAAGGGIDLAAAIGQAVYSAVYDAMRVARAGGDGERPFELVLELDGTPLGRLMLPALRREAQRIGMRLVEV